MNVFSKVRCVVFDLDDTLWPCEPTITKAEEALYQWLQKNYSRITNLYSFEALKQHRADFGVKHPELAHNVTKLRHQSLAELAKESGYNSGMADKGLSLFRKVRNEVNFYDDACSTLDQLKIHFKIGAVTNGNADLYAIGVSEKFDFVVTAEEAGAAKPDNKIFKYAQDKIQLDSHEIVYVGDEPSIDVIGALQSGWRAIWFNPGQQRWVENQKPDVEISQLNQLLDLLPN